jgi:uncharacterized protein (DUF305 family)
MQNTNVLYGIIGLLAGIIITSGFCFYNHHRDSGMENDTMGMEHQMQGMMVGLEGKTGDAFDKEFLSEMIVHHEGAIEMANAVLATSKRPELIKLANDIISAQTKEITMMQEWQKNWFK